MNLTRDRVKLSTWLSFNFARSDFVLENKTQIAIYVPKIFFKLQFQYWRGGNKMPWFDMWENCLMTKRLYKPFEFDGAQSIPKYKIKMKTIVEDMKD